MSKNYCTFEQAKLLKIKGFPQENQSSYFKENGEIENGFTDLGLGSIACPTLTEVQEWLRNEKKIHVYPIYYLSRSNDIEWYSCEINSKLLPNSIRVDNEENGGCFNTYDEALSNGIDKTLLLI